MTISTRWSVRENRCASEPYMRGLTMRQDALTPKVRAPRTCKVPWYQRLGVMLVVVVGILGQILVLWTVGQILMLWLGV